MTPWLLRGLLNSGLSMNSWRLIFGVFLVLHSSHAWALHTAIVGAGLSGLTAAYRLNNFGMKIAIFEAQKHSGGRVRTKEIPELDLAVEEGGTFVDSNHGPLINLTKELSIDLVRVIKDDAPLNYQVVNNKLSFSHDNFERFHETLAMLQAVDHDDVGDIVASDYLERIKAPQELVILLNLITQNEYGVDLEAIRVCELFDIISLDFERRYFSIDGNLGDEAFIIKNGGRDLISKLSNSLQDNLKFEHVLTAISEHDNFYTLSFKTPEGIQDIQTKRVIITLPLDVLKNIEINLKNFPRYLLDYIHERPTGRNFKIWLFFKKPWWRDIAYGRSFNLITNNYWIWDNSDDLQGYNNFGLTAFVGGSNAERASAMSDEEIAREVLKALELVSPGCKEYYITTKRGHEWHKDCFALGSYTGLRSLNNADYEYARAQQEPYYQGVFFAGAAWDQESEGFMNGAVKTGERAALWARDQESQ